MNAQEMAEIILQEINLIENNKVKIPKSREEVLGDITSAASKIEIGTTHSSTNPLSESVENVIREKHMRRKAQKEAVLRYKRMLGRRMLFILLNSHGLKLDQIKYGMKNRGRQIPNDPFGRRIKFVKTANSILGKVFSAKMK